jgi:hypothetical protein
MTRNRATIAHIARIEATRDIIDQAAAEGRVLRGEQQLDLDDRLYRLASRYRAHRSAGRMQAAAAVKRMAERLIASIAE